MELLTDEEGGGNFFPAVHSCLKVANADYKICHQKSVLDLASGEVVGHWKKFSGQDNAKMYEVNTKAIV